MPKASPMIRSFNAGEFSELLTGRVDLDRYPASLRALYNAVAAPQGPAICRSGTSFVATARSDDSPSVLFPFVFSSDQALVLEFADDRIRFYTEGGLLTYPSEAAAVTSAAGAAITFTSADLDADVGDEVVLHDFPPQYNLNGQITEVTAKVGTSYTLALTYPAGVTVVDGDAARVYHVPSSYTLQQRQALRPLQSVDVVYLFCEFSKTYKLSRFGTYDWRLEVVNYFDGPYQPINETDTTLTPSATGNKVDILTSDAGGPSTATGSSFRPLINGSVGTPAPFLNRNITYQLPVAEYYKAFDGNDDTYWAANTAQFGTLQYTHSAPFVADGYTIYAAKDNQDTSYSAKDFAPSTFLFEAYDGVNWVTLDRQEDYVLYDGGKSVFFPLTNTVAYAAYRLRIQNLFRNGLIEPRVRRLVIREKSNVTLTLTASAVTGINADTGFQTTDVGRLIRIKGSDGAWRACEIVTRTSTTQIGVKLLGEPILNLEPIKEWRLGYWSDTTGWPGCGDFFEDRMWAGGATDSPDLLAGSVVGAYESFQQTDPFGTVLDDNAVVVRLNSRKLSRISWVSSDSRGLLIGTGSEEYVLSAPSSEPLTARNLRARPATRRGSADVEPVRIDAELLFVQRGGRAIRELAFVFEADGYKAPSMSQLASHIGAVPFVKMVYSQEPHSIVWVLKADGTLAGLTYNRDENVIGWHQHDFAGAVVESIAVIPQPDGLQDALWMQVRRSVGGVQKRYIERLTRFWDFNTALEDAHYVDSGLRYTGEPAQTIYGLSHLEGEEVYGLADNRPVGPYTVENGAITLEYEASNAVLGLGFEAYGYLPKIENGAADGTAQGKVKRVNSLVVSVWRSFGGEIGVYNEQRGEYTYEPLEPKERLYDVFEEVNLFTGNIGPITPSPGYDLDGLIAFRRPKESTLPFNIVAIMPQLHTQDR